MVSTIFEIAKGKDKGLDRKFKSDDGKGEVRDIQVEEFQKILSEWHIGVVSSNNFNTAAGLASSSSGLSCLGCALATLLGLKEGDVDFSILARLGSGSACRSTLGGFVIWNKGWS